MADNAGAGEAGPINNWGIIGHDRVVGWLERAVQRGALVHAYAIVGPPAVGKRTLALALARRLACTGSPAPCGRCRPCRAIAAGTFPDVAVVEPLGDGEDDEGARRRAIKIDQVREVLRQASLTPYEAERKVFILREAETMAGGAADALLKTLEEPPARAILILTARDDTLLPSTVASRCQIIRLNPVAADRIIGALQEQGRPVDLATRVARLARGAPGWAIAAAADERLVRQREEALADWLAMLPARSPARLQFAGTLEKLLRQDPDGFADAMALWVDWWRAVLRLGEGQRDSATLAAAGDRTALLDACAAAVTPDAAARYLGVIVETLRRLDTNAQPRLALEVLALEAPVVGAPR